MIAFGLLHINGFVHLKLKSSSSDPTRQESAIPGADQINPENNRPDADLTYFPDFMDNFNQLFDEEDFLSRNPEIRERLECSMKQ